MTSIYSEVSQRVNKERAKMDRVKMDDMIDSFSNFEGFFKALFSGVPQIKRGSTVKVIKDCGGINKNFKGVVTNVYQDGVKVFGSDVLIPLESVKVMQEERNSQNYKFFTQSEFTVNYSRIAKDLTPEHPVAIVKSSRGLEEVVLVSGDLIKKSIACNIPLVSEDFWAGWVDIGVDYVALQPDNSTTIKSLLDAIKEVQEAKWDKEGETLVEVYFPKI